MVSINFLRKLIPGMDHHNIACMHCFRSNQVVYKMPMKSHYSLACQIGNKHKMYVHSCLFAVVAAYNTRFLYLCDYKMIVCIYNICVCSYASVCTLS